MFRETFTLLVKTSSFCCKTFLFYNVYCQVDLLHTEKGHQNIGTKHIKSLFLPEMIKGMKIIQSRTKDIRILVSAIIFHLWYVGEVLV